LRQLIVPGGFSPCKGTTGTITPSALGSTSLTQAHRRREIEKTQRMPLLNFKKKTRRSAPIRSLWRNFRRKNHFKNIFHAVPARTLCLL
jgi:hypothetical protein